MRDTGAEVVVGNLLDLDAMHRVIAGGETMYFGMSVSDAYLAATVNMAAVAKHHGVKAFINMSQMTLSQMSLTDQAITWFAGERFRLQEVASWPGLVAGAEGWVLWSGMRVNTNWEIVGIGIMNGQEHGVSAHCIHEGEGSCTQ